MHRRAKGGQKDEEGCDYIGMAIMEDLTEARTEVCKLGDYVFQLEMELKSLGLYN